VVVQRRRSSWSASAPSWAGLFLPARRRRPLHPPRLEADATGSQPPDATVEIGPHFLDVGADAGARVQGRECAFGPMELCEKLQRTSTRLSPLDVTSQIAFSATLKVVTEPREVVAQPALNLQLCTRPGLSESEVIHA